jgi:branched-chain amino acid transport system substrate-binding protein
MVVKAKAKEVGSMIRARRLIWIMVAVLMGVLSACGEEAGPSVTPQATAPRGEPYKVGYMADVTGPGANTWAPTLEGFRLYVQYINARGGINGHPIQLVSADNRSDASLAAAQAKKFIESDRVHIILQSSASVTQQPVIEQAQSAGVPFVIVEVGCPSAAFPPNPQRNVFCPLLAPQYDNEAFVRFIKAQADKLGRPVKVVGVAYDVPSSRSGVEYGIRRAQELGLEVVDQIVVPVRGYDHNAIASRIISKGADWVFGWGTWEHTGGPLLEALRRQGWQGGFVAPPLSIAESEMARMKDDKMFTGRHVVMSFDDVPGMRDLKDAYQRFGATFPPDRLIWGWVAGMMAVAAFERCGWPCTPQQLTEVMQALSVDTKGITGAPIVFTPTDHVGQPLYRFYAWDRAQGRLAIVQDWTSIR